MKNELNIKMQNLEAKLAEEQKEKNTQINEKEREKI